MRKLTDEDLSKIRGTTVKGYYIEAVKVKRGPFIDSDHYGIILGRNSKDQYVTWEFYLLEDGSVSVYWGHYMEDREAALRDYNARGTDTAQKFHVTVTETFRLTIGVEAESKEKAEQIVTTDWRNKEFTLGPEDFAGVEFETVPEDGRE